MRIIVGAALLLTAACGITACGTNAAPPASSALGAGTGTWRKFPPPPISPRLGAVTAWTGVEALFLGGDSSAPCPPNADCLAPPGDIRDGAAFDPERGTWRKTATAPAPIEPYSPSAVIGDEVFLLTADALLSYDASDDAWTRHPAPSTGLGYARLVANGDDIIVVRDERHRADPLDQTYDSKTQIWSTMPADPLGPAFDRVLTATPAGLVLTGQDLVSQPGSEKHSIVRAALLDPKSGRWTLLSDSDQLGGGRWIWTGTRMLDPTLGGADGGEVNGYARMIPYGGVLDPVLDEWGRLPHPPEQLTGGWVVEALAGPLAAVEGWVYDDRDESWIKLLRPYGAPTQAGSAVWADEQLIVLGGVDLDKGYTVEALSNDAWSYDAY